MLILLYKMFDRGCRDFLSSIETLVKGGGGGNENEVPLGTGLEEKNLFFHSRSREMPTAMSVGTDYTYLHRMNVALVPLQKPRMTVRWCSQIWVAAPYRDRTIKNGWLFASMNSYFSRSSVSILCKASDVHSENGVFNYQPNPG